MFLRDIKKLNISLLKRAIIDTKEAKSINEIAEILQPFSYLSDILLGRDLQKIKICLNYLKDSRMKDIANLLNEGN